MKPTRQHHDEALRCCQAFSRRHPDFNPRATVIDGTQEQKIVRALYQLNDVASSWACNDSCRVTPARFHSAVATLDAMP